MFQIIVLYVMHDFRIERKICFQIYINFDLQNCCNISKYDIMNVIIYL